ncbi:MULTISPECIES: AMP-binding protein [unclassified Alteromonas]|uniref:AMP-binding protein n=1 Tax=unclassified Alteromonas TaxID=2614992 RepID=UPI0005093CB6|nr:MULTISPECIES: AMP-binding protein [unclassified Alteromonas]
MINTYHWSKEDEGIERLIIELIIQACSYRDLSKKDIVDSATHVDNRNRWYLDSLATYQALSYICEFFNIHDDDNINSLVATPNLSAIADLCAHAMNQDDAAITFYTSGSESKPKKITHTLSALIREAEDWMQTLPAFSHVLSTVPSKHIYGFIWTVVLPKIANITATEVQKMTVHSLDITHSTLMISVPAMVHLIDRLPDISKSNTHLVLSTAPLDFDILQHLHKNEYKSALQIYGATETGGIGLRTGDSFEYSLRQSLRRVNTRVFNEDHCLALQDNLVFSDDRRFKVEGRHDNKIQINGYNVCPDDIKYEVSLIPEVNDVAVRVVQSSINNEVKLYVALDNVAKKFNVMDSLTQKLGSLVSLHNVTFGQRVPRNEMGKLCDWD